MPSCIFGIKPNLMMLSRASICVTVLLLFVIPNRGSAACEGLAENITSLSLSQEPFIVSGQFKNITPGDMMFFFRNPETGHKSYVIEQLKVDSNGFFHLKTNAIKQPVMATLRKEFVSVNFYAAPGYNLEISGDVSEPNSFQQRKQISGKGSLANQYLFKTDSIEWALSAKDTTQWSDLPFAALIKYAENYQRRQDSLHRLVFARPATTDKWFGALSDMAKIDARSLKLYYILSAIERDTSLSYAQSVALLAKHGDKALLDDLYNKKYMVSENYKSWLMGTYAYYLRELANRKTPGYKKDDEMDLQLVEQIASNYRGNIREMKLYNKLEQVVANSRSFEELQRYNEKLPSIISTLTDSASRYTIDSLLTAMNKSMKAAQAGKMAPGFVAYDSTGKSFTSGDFAGKVVYIDFWASWCVPCRAEIPNMKKLVDKYRGDSSLVVLSIGVMDQHAKWKKAVVADQPYWLQLFDKDGTAQKAFFTNSVPRYVLINKRGEIVNFDAPGPGKIEGIIEGELGR